MIRHILLRTLVPVCLLCGCAEQPASKHRSETRETTVADVPDAMVQVPIINSTLSDEERRQFYHLTMGGEIIPLTWMRALESEATHQPFLEQIERFNMLPDPDNPDGLPVGLTAAESTVFPRLGKMVGVNCSMCHVTEFSYQGKRFRLEGAPNPIRFDLFAKDLAQTVLATIKTPSKRHAFLSRLLDPADSAIGAATRKRLKVIVDSLSKLDQSVAADLSAGEKEVAGHLKGLIEKIESSKEESLGRLRSLHERLFSSERIEATEESRPFASELEELTNVLRSDRVQQSAVLKQMIELGEPEIREGLNDLISGLRLLKARVDLVRKFKGIFAQNLQVTEGGPGRFDDFGGARLIFFESRFALPLTAPTDIPHLWGTKEIRWLNWDGNTTSGMERAFSTALGFGAWFDSETKKSSVSPRNLNILDKLADSLKAPVWPQEVFGPIDRQKFDRGKELFSQHCARCHITEVTRPSNLPADELWPPDRLYSLDEVKTDPNRAHIFAATLAEGTFADKHSKLMAEFVQQSYKDKGISEALAQEWEEYRPDKWRAMNQYVGRGLRAVWASPPYLHNASVPTLYDLLLPANQRRAKFPVGHREYDPIKLGYAAEAQGATVDMRDTSIEGNHNSGHEYGTQLSEEERWAILEYLKGT